MVEPSLPVTEMMKVHGELDRLFRDHQVALVERDLPRAVSLLVRFRTQLLQHMEEEERFVLPLYESVCGQLPGGGRDLFELEHAKIRSNLERLVKELQLLEVQGRSALTADAAVERIDRAWPFKGLLRHHELREQNILYPCLERALDERARAAFWEDVAGSRLEQQRLLSRYEREL